MCTAMTSGVKDQDPNPVPQPEPEPEPQAVVLEAEGENSDKQLPKPESIGADIGTDEDDEELGIASRRRNPFLNALTNTIANTGLVPVSRVTLGA